jgi:hypothetical protein
VPRYHFHVEDGETLPDVEGLELPDDHAAKVAALRYLAELLGTYPRLVWATNSLQLTVTNERRLMLFTVDLGVTISPASSLYRARVAQPGGDG